MKHGTLRLIGILVAVLIVGTVAFAVAMAAQSPRASQIPTVVTSASVDATPMPALVTTPAPAPASISSTTVVLPKGKQNAAKDAHAGKASSDREVVTPGVRDDGDSNGKGSGDRDRDSDDQDSSSGGGATATGARSSSGSASGKSGSGTYSQRNSSKTQSIDRHRNLRIAASARVRRDLPSGKNLPGTFN